MYFICVQKSKSKEQKSFKYTTSIKQDKAVLKWTVSVVTNQKSPSQSLGQYRF